MDYCKELHVKTFRLLFHKYPGKILGDYGKTYKVFFIILGRCILPLLVYKHVEGISKLKLLAPECLSFCHELRLTTDV